MQQNGKWSRIVNAYRTMKHSGRISYYAKIHQDIFGQIHNTIQFLTWHRAFIWEFENEIRSIGGNDLTLPYIDWAAEGTAYNGQVDQSVANHPYYYAKQNGQCLAGQVYDTFMLAGQFNGGQCIRRSTDQSVLVAGWADLDNNIINNRAFSGFSDSIQYGIHANVHIRFGGHMGSTYSPVDPMFFGHHGFIDMTMNIWQYVRSNFNNMGSSISTRTFTINGNTYTHGGVFAMNSMCARYQRYVESRSSRKLKKRQSDTNSTDSPTPTNTTATSTTSESPEATATESGISQGEHYDAPDIPSYSDAEIASYNDDLVKHYDDLKSKLNSTDDCQKSIAGFYTGSFLPLDNHPSDDALAKLGLDPSKYKEVAATIFDQREQLSKAGEFVRKTVEQVKSENKDKYPSAGSGASAQSPVIMFVIFMMQ